MLYYQITCEPDGKTKMALAAPDEPNVYGPLVVDEFDANPPIDSRQLWQLVGFAQVISKAAGVWNTFFLLNKRTGYAAQAPKDAKGNVKPDTQGVSQVDISSFYDVASPVLLWTIDFAGGAFAIRPHGNSKQDLNAWKKLAVPGTEVGVYQWQGAKPNEVWATKAVWL